MKAAQINRYGDPSVIEINDVAKPSLQDGQVLVEVHASSLNPYDTAVRSGAAKARYPLDFPATLGGDIAGIVTEVGAGVQHVAKGDQVYGQAYAGTGSGAFAEYAAAAASQVAKMPTNLDFQQAGSLPLVGVSAWQALHEHLKLQAGQRIFIHGGAGGIGSLAIQIAKHIGAHVATTATGDDIAKVTRLGADQVVDYKTEDFASILNDFDAVFDTVGHDDFDKALGVLRRGGIAVSMVAPPNEARASELGVTALMQFTKVTTPALDALRELVESGAVAPQVSRTFPLVKIQAAFEARETSHVPGKIVITIKD